MKKTTKKFLFISVAFVVLYIEMKVIARGKSEDNTIDDDNIYLSTDEKEKSIYENIIKPALDQMFSFGGLIALSPLYLLISLAVYLDDPGTVFFTQKRVGKNGHFFMLHKYRSMKMETPHDIPTHLLTEPDQYITRVGKILRRTSLDELPQIWDIFRGKMSVIGPRPALWNQEDLIEERNKYGANEIVPGLTGLAQIKGRDKLFISDKAKIDGEYTANLHKGGMTALRQDVTCLLRTIVSVWQHDGIIEGGTGAIDSKDDFSKSIITDMEQDQLNVKGGENIRKTSERLVREKKETKSHILIISQYFYPETFRINDMAVEWVKRGHRVTVLTGIPNYPIGKFYRGYDYIHRRSETWNGIQIIRIPLIPRGSSSFGLIVNYFSFVVSGWLWKMTADIHADIVFTYGVSPMTQALIGCWYSGKYHIPHFLYVQDLWPENVETVTGIHNKTIIKPIDSMVAYIYEHSSQIFATSRSFVQRIIKRGVDKNKVHYWPQYAEDFYRPLDRETVRMEAKKESLVHLIPEDDTFNIIFTGNIGTAQGLDILPKVAESLKDSYRNIRFIIVGEGRYQNKLEAEIKIRRVEASFIIIPRQPAEIIPCLLSCCDAAFLSFNKSRLWEMTIPAKLQSYMACGMPIIAAAQGETKTVIDEAGCGICCKNGDVEALAEAIQELQSADLKQMGQNSRMYAEKHYKKSVIMDEMEEFLN